MVLVTLRMSDIALSALHILTHLIFLSQDYNLVRTSLVTQCLELHTPNAGGIVGSLVGELRSQMPHVAKKTEKEKMQKLRTFRNLGKDW